MKPAIFHQVLPTGDQRHNIDQMIKRSPYFQRRAPGKLRYASVGANESFGGVQQYLNYLKV